MFQHGQKHQAAALYLGWGNIEGVESLGTSSACTPAVDVCTTEAGLDGKPTWAYGPLSQGRLLGTCATQMQFALALSASMQPQTWLKQLWTAAVTLALHVSLSDVTCWAIDDDWMNAGAQKMEIHHRSRPHIAAACKAVPACALVAVRCVLCSCDLIQTVPTNTLP